MTTITHQPGARRLQVVLIAYIILLVLCLLVVYIIAPAIYVQTLMLEPSASDRYPLLVNLFLLGILTLLTLLIIGILKRWRWIFWIMLLAFSASIIQVPLFILQLAQIVPAADPAWYTLFRLCAVIGEIGMAVWMIQILRHDGVWGMRNI